MGHSSSGRPLEPEPDPVFVELVAFWVPELDPEPDPAPDPELDPVPVPLDPPLLPLVELPTTGVRGEVELPKVPIEFPLPVPPFVPPPGIN